VNSLSLPLVQKPPVTSLSLAIELSTQFETSGKHPFTHNAKGLGSCSYPWRSLTAPTLAVVLTAGTWRPQFSTMNSSPRVRACAFKIFRRNSLLTSGWSIVHTMHVVNFGHLDGLVWNAYDWCPLDKFRVVIEGANSNGE
jgi:hypothetical protein